MGELMGAKYSGGPNYDFADQAGQFRALSFYAKLGRLPYTVYPYTVYPYTRIPYTRIPGYRIPYTVYRIPYTRIPYTVYRIPVYPYRIPATDLIW